MAVSVVVLGAGYAGAGAVKTLQAALPPDAQLTWISETDYHLVLHEVHRAIRDPSVEPHITIPVQEIADSSTDFVQGRVVDVDVEEREVVFEDGTTVPYDYVLVALGSRTAYYGIPGLEEHAFVLEGLDDALAIHDAVNEAATEATRGDPASVVVGGAGLSGIQVAGEIAEFRDRRRAPLDVTIVEALDEIFPGNDPAVQSTLRKKLEEADVAIRTADPITEVDDEQVYFEEESLPYDVFVWTGGITGRAALDGADLTKDHNRIHADATFQTSDERVFAIGDAAIVDQNDTLAPPTAQAAWQAAAVAGENVVRTIQGEPLERWRFSDKGTVVSVGEEAVAHDVLYSPISTFGSLPARQLKKFIAARWIADVTSWGRARKAWPYL